MISPQVIPLPYSPEIIKNFKAEVNHAIFKKEYFLWNQMKINNIKFGKKVWLRYRAKKAKGLSQNSPISSGNNHGH